MNEPEWKPWSPPNWPAIFTAARERGEFTPSEKSAAKAWHTCAVGAARFKQPDVVLLRDIVHGCPADAILSDLGVQFCGAVRSDNPDLAEVIYEEIQERVGLLAGVAAL